MTNFKDTVKINLDSEKYLYRIMKELTRDGESIIEKADTDEWSGALRSFGIKTSELREKGLIDPIFKPIQSSGEEKRLIRIPNDVEVKEIVFPKTTYFRFQRRKLI